MDGRFVSWGKRCSWKSRLIFYHEPLKPYELFCSTFPKKILLEGQKGDIIFAIFALLREEIRKKQNDAKKGISHRFVNKKCLPQKQQQAS